MECMWWVGWGGGAEGVEGAEEDEEEEEDASVPAAEDKEEDKSEGGTAGPAGPAGPTPENEGSRMDGSGDDDEDVARGSGPPKDIVVVKPEPASAVVGAMASIATDAPVGTAVGKAVGTAVGTSIGAADAVGSCTFTFRTMSASMQAVAMLSRMAAYWSNRRRSQACLSFSSPRAKVTTVSRKER